MEKDLQAAFVHHFNQAENKMSREQKLMAWAASLGFDTDAAIQIGGHYVPVLREGAQVYVSGQIPRVLNKVVVTGRAGVEVNVEQAQYAAKLCVLRALTLLRQELGSLDAIARILRINVYVQSGEDFTQQSEVADGASDLLFDILGEAGAHTRTSVGVYQLPKNATVELDVVATVTPAYLQVCS
ncbi:RidA family protein [Vitreoscilla massiliensis]|uniref:RidA family protein n=1 Tax=Vitreoscilla massiliensis TaxID=1689272 RepID=A0ABY4E5S4_9NEIS|nr:RidA family protein [Vitreoscilla massiliensis]UOO91134.1 RidA family protein [Vitreoscilla massiliensis]